MYKGEDTEDQSIEALQKQTLDIYNRYKCPKPRTRKNSSVESCNICSEPLVPDRARYHCHIPGYYHGAAQNGLNYRIDHTKWKLPVNPHNLRSYDGQMIIKALKKKFGRTRVIGTNRISMISNRHGTNLPDIAKLRTHLILMLIILGNRGLNAPRLMSKFP